MTQKPCEYHVSQTIEGNFTILWSQVGLGS